MFEDGATFIAGVSLPATVRGRSGKHSIVGMVTTKEFTPFDVGPGEASPVEPPAALTPRSGSWIVQYKMYQHVKEWEDAGGAPRGWGMFATFVAADGWTNKSALVLTLGLGGVPFTRRQYDRFGIAYSQDGVSLKYREQARPFNLNSENVFEAFYSFAVTRFIKTTADLQVIRPMWQGSGTAVLPGVRLVIDL
jgi:hypothetical protein